jgi:pimeloyl-ACP methyl ester carboxylesterase
VLYARPNYSGSSPAPGRTVADAAVDTAAVLDALGVEQFINIGWSGGGPHALACDVLLRDRCAATAVIGSLTPYVGSTAWPEIKSWYEADEDNQLALSGDVDGFRRSCQAFAEMISHVTADGVTVNAKSTADREYLSSGYAEWIASMFREGVRAGGDGFADDFLAFFAHWGFPLADARQVRIWHGTDDQNVPIVHAHRLAAEMPDAELHVINGEGHVSIMKYFEEIVEDLIKQSSVS